MSDEAGTGAAEADGKQEKPKTEDPSRNTGTEPVAKFTEEDLNQAREAARQQEKDKLYEQIAAEKRASEAEKAEKAKIKAALEEKAKELAALKAKLEEDADAKLSGKELVQKKLEQLEQSNEALRSQLAIVAEESAKRVAESEQRAYRNQAVAKAELLLTDLVPELGEKAEIDAAIEYAKDIEARLTKSAEDRVREELAGKVPKPVAPASDPSQTTVVSRFDPKSIRNMNRKEYAAWRAQKLEAARNGGARS